MEVNPNESEAAKRYTEDAINLNDERHEVHHAQRDGHSEETLFSFEVIRRCIGD